MHQNAALCANGKEEMLVGSTPFSTIFSSINTLPHDKRLTFSKLKAFADEELNVPVCQYIEFIVHVVENIVGKGESAGS